MKTILIIVGTRPEAIKLAPLYLALKAKNKSVLLLTTGQHSDMIDSVFSFFKIKADLSIQLSRKTNSLSELTSQLFIEIESAFQKLKPDLVVVQGDTTSAFVGSMCAFYNKIKVAHVEAGLRTFNKQSPFPEESNRVLIGELADYHFAPTIANARNLQLINKKNIFVTGNTVIDALLIGKKIIANDQPRYKEKFKGVIKEKEMNILITGHRRESFGDGFLNICQAILELSEYFREYNFIYPVHLNPNVKKVVEEHLSDQSNVILLSPLSYDDMLFILSQSKLILTDSGGIQEEAPSFNIPVVVLRNHTEREEGIRANCSILVGTDKDTIVNETKRILENEQVYQKMAIASNPYGNGTASEKIAEIFESTVFNDDF